MRLDTVSLRGMNRQHIHGSKRSLRSVEDFTEFEKLLPAVQECVAPVGPLGMEASLGLLAVRLPGRPRTKAASVSRQPVLPPSLALWCNGAGGQSPFGLRVA
jgi:hypothetical protein